MSKVCELFLCLFMVTVMADEFLDEFQLGSSAETSDVVENGVVQDWEASDLLGTATQDFFPWMATDVEIAYVMTLSTESSTIYSVSGTNLEGSVTTDTSARISLSFVCLSEGTATVTMNITVGDNTPFDVSFEKTCVFPLLNVDIGADDEVTRWVEDGVVLEYDAFSEDQDFSVFQFTLTAGDDYPVDVSVDSSVSTILTVDNGGLITTEPTDVTISYNCGRKTGKSRVTVNINIGWEEDLQLEYSKYCSNRANNSIAWSSGATWGIVIFMLVLLCMCSCLAYLYIEEEEEEKLSLLGTAPIPVVRKNPNYKREREKAKGGERKQPSQGSGGPDGDDSSSSTPSGSRFSLSAAGNWASQIMSGVGSRGPQDYQKDGYSSVATAQDDGGAAGFHSQL